MTFKVKFDTDNAAFDGDRDMEIARILRRIAQTVEVEGAPTQFKTILDVNGNDVGRFALKTS